MAVRRLAIAWVLQAIAGSSPANEMPVAAARDPLPAVRRLVRDSDGAGTLVVDPTSGAVVVVRGASFALAGGRERPAEAAREWLAGHAEAFGLEPDADALEIERDDALPGGGRRVLIRQRWHGLPVLGGDARAIVDREGRLAFVSAGFVRALRAPRVAIVPGDRAVVSAAAALGLDPGRMAGGPVLGVARDGGGDRLVWSVRGVHADGRPSLTTVDAVTGAVLEADAGVAHAVGLVYPTDPRDPLEELPLERLLPGRGLRSSDVAIEDLRRPPIEPIAPDDYRYPPDAPQFDQVNVYWHVGRFLHGFLAGLGYAGVPESLIVRVHYSDGTWPAFTSGRFVYFGEPIPNWTRDAALSHDVIYHELTHAVLYGYGILPGGNRREASALHEGLADYFSAALTGDPVLGEWEYLLFPAGVTRVDRPAPPWDYEHYDQVGFNGGEAGSAWGNGMILSSGLWDLRGRIGAACDSLVLESLAYMSTIPDWAQFTNAMLQADVDHHGGRLGSEIAGQMGKRKMIRHGTLSASIVGPTTLAPGVEGEFRAQTCCGGPVRTYRWRARTWCRGVPCGDWSEVGDQAVLRIAFDADADLELQVTSQWGDVVVSRTRVGVRPPILLVDGPTRIAEHTVGTWRARIAAAGPATVTWERRWRRAGSAPVPLGEGVEKSFVADSSFEITATLADGLGRSVSRSLDVETFVDRPPPLATGGVRLTQRLDAGARHAETRFELPRTTPMSLAAYDVRGRIRARLWDAPAARGGHVLRWDTTSLEPGIYFLRLIAEPTGAVLRFAIVR